MLEQPTPPRRLCTVMTEAVDFTEDPICWTIWMALPEATLDPRALVSLTDARFYSCVGASIRASPYPFGVTRQVPG